MEVNYIDVCVCICIYVYRFVYIYICICICICTYIYVYVYIYIYLNSTTPQRGGVVYRLCALIRGPFCGPFARPAGDQRLDRARLGWRIVGRWQATFFGAKGIPFKVTRQSGVHRRDALKTRKQTPNARMTLAWILYGSSLASVQWSPMLILRVPQGLLWNVSAYGETIWMYTMSTSSFPWISYCKRCA